VLSPSDDGLSLVPLATRLGQTRWRLQNKEGLPRWSDDFS